MDKIKPGAGTQSIERASQLLRVIASRNGTGLRLVELSRHTKLERPTVHRILKCLVKEGVIKQDAATHLFLRAVDGGVEVGDG